MTIYVILKSDSPIGRADDMKYVGCTITYDGAIHLMETMFGKVYKNTDCIKDTDTCKYFFTNEHFFEGKCICIKKEKVK